MAYNFDELNTVKLWNISDNFTEHPFRNIIKHIT